VFPKRGPERAFFCVIIFLIVFHLSIIIKKMPEVNIPTEQEGNSAVLNEQPKFEKNNNQKNKFIIISLIVVVIFATAVLVANYQDQLFASVMNSLVFRVKVTPSKVVQGQTIVVSWPTFNKDRFPLERISFCTVSNKSVCKIMLKSTMNDGQQKVIVNSDIGQYRVLLQALDANGNYVPGVKITSNSFRVENKPGESGNGSGGNDDNNDGGDPSTPTNAPTTPTPDLPYGPY